MAEAKTEKDPKARGAPELDEIEIIGEDDDFDSASVDEEGAPSQDEETEAEAGSDDQPDSDTEREKERLRAERRAKKAKEKENKKLQKELDQLRRSYDELRNGVGALQQAEVSRIQQSAQSRVQAAEQQLRKAMEDGDADAHIQAQRELLQAENEKREVDKQVETARRGNRVEATDRSRSSADQNDDDVGEDTTDNTRQQLAQAWAKKNSWFDPSLSDDDSNIVATISTNIAREGISPDSEEHFEELDRRVAKYLPHRVEKGQTKPQKKQPMQTSANAAPGGSKAHNGQMQIPRATIRAFESRGYDWNNADDRKHIIAKVKESRAARGTEVE